LIIGKRWNNLVALGKRYPRQFWLMFVGMMISTTGGSMIWPFLMIYAKQRLDLPLTVVTSLMTLNAAAGLAASFLAGPLVDRFGRKWMMVISLLANGLAYVFLGQASTLLLMGLSGAVNPLFRVGSDAMLADLMPEKLRIDGYSLLRTGNNVGVALGPVIGGMIAATSYTLAFYLAALGMCSYSLLLAFFAHETLPKRTELPRQSKPALGGYGRIFRDRPFMSFFSVFVLTQMCSAILWILLSVYAKENYQVPERLYGFLPMTNALMVVFLQVAVTQWTKRYPPLWMVCLGTGLYAIGVGSVALGRGFGGFWISMVILTVGELILSPTATTYVANLAPADMRGRYMGLYGLTWNVAAGIGPVMGGFLNDSFGPVFIWYGAFIIGLISTLRLLGLAIANGRVKEVIE
jgi:MFS family permease